MALSASTNYSNSRQKRPLIDIDINSSKTGDLFSRSIETVMKKRGRFDLSQQMHESAANAPASGLASGSAPKFRRSSYNSTAGSIGTAVGTGEAAAQGTILSASKFCSGKETDPLRIEARMKQIQFGKNTIGYDNYLAAVPKEKRGRYCEHPRTPDPYEMRSKRAFDGCVKAWRRALHVWDSMETIAFSSTSGTAVATAPTAAHSASKSTAASSKRAAADASDSSSKNILQSTGISSSSASLIAKGSIDSGGIDDDAIECGQTLTTGEEEELAAVQWGTDLPIEAATAAAADGDDEVDDEEDVL